MSDKPPEKEKFSYDLNVNNLDDDKIIFHSKNWLIEFWGIFSFCFPIIIFGILLLVVHNYDDRPFIIIGSIVFSVLLGHISRAVYQYFNKLTGLAVLKDSIIHSVLIIIFCIIIFGIVYLF